MSEFSLSQNVVVRMFAPRGGPGAKVKSVVANGMIPVSIKNMDETSEVTVALCAFPFGSQSEDPAAIRF